MKKLFARFMQDEIRCNGDRIRPHRRRHLGRDHTTVVGTLGSGLKTTFTSVQTAIK